MRRGDISWRVVETLEGEYVVDHKSIAYPRKSHITLSEAFDYANERFRQWEVNCAIIQQLKDKANG